MSANIVTPTASINDLNNDCLREILLYIKVNERIKLRRVCKKWRNSVDDCWREVRKVNIIDSISKYGDGNKKKEIVGTNHVVLIRTSDQPVIAGVMKRCGDVIKSLSEYRQEKNNSALALAIKHCSNIERLKTTVRTKVDDKNASQLLARNKKLRILDLQIEFKNAKLCFLKIPTEYLTTLQLTVGDCRSPSIVILFGHKQVISQCSSLEELFIDYFDDELIGLVGQKIALKNLSLYCNHARGITTAGLTPILSLKNLCKLEIEATPAAPAFHNRRKRYFPPITDDFLMSLAENLSLLEVIIIGSPTNVTDKGFKSLATLERLRELRITDCPKVTDEFLVLFAGLDELSTVNCSIRDEGVIKLLEKAVTMQLLNLDETQITNATLAAAVKATSKRSNGIVLSLYNAGTNTTPFALVETSPLLKIVDENSWEF